MKSKIYSENKIEEIRDRRKRQKLFLEAYINICNQYNINFTYDEAGAVGIDDLLEIIAEGSTITSLKMVAEQFLEYDFNEEATFELENIGATRKL